MVPFAPCSNHSTPSIHHPLRTSSLPPSSSPSCPFISPLPLHAPCPRPPISPYKRHQCPSIRASSPLRRTQPHTLPLSGIVSPNDPCLTFFEAAASDEFPYRNRAFGESPVKPQPRWVSGKALVSVLSPTAEKVSDNILITIQGERDTIASSFTQGVLVTSRNGRCSPISLQPSRRRKRLAIHAFWSTSKLAAPSIAAQFKFSLSGTYSRFYCQHITSSGTETTLLWNSLGASRVVIQSRPQRIGFRRKYCITSAFGLPCSQIASYAFTVGTVAVLPFYTLMVLAPNTELTKKCIDSNIPYIILGALYVYLLYLSWTPDTVRLMFASKYWLPELPGIAKMFSSEMTLASAWVHLLAVDLFAARQIFHDGLKNNIETRHSVSLCLLFCPIGIVTHAITRALILYNDKRKVIQSHA